MTYNNTSAISSFSIVSRRSRGSAQQQQLAKCVTKADSATDAMNSSCYTATVAHLRRNQLVFIYNNPEFYRRIVTTSQSSFWGVFKIG